MSGWSLNKKGNNLKRKKTPHNALPEMVSNYIQNQLQWGIYIYQLKKTPHTVF